MKGENQFSLETLEEKIAFIESILFVSKEPVEPEKVMHFLNCKSVADFEKIISRMEEEYKNNGRGIVLKRSGGGLQLTTKPVMHDFLKDFFTKRSPGPLKGRLRTLPQNVSGSAKEGLKKGFTRATLIVRKDQPPLLSVITSRIESLSF